MGHRCQKEKFNRKNLTNLIVFFRKWELRVKIKVKRKEGVRRSNSLRRKKRSKRRQRRDRVKSS